MTTIADDRYSAKALAEAIVEGMSSAVERAVTAERARCVAVCRGVEAACAPDSTEHATARAIREAIERGAVGL